MLKIMSPSQCRGARALLDLTQPQLAKAAQVGLSTVVDFERERRSVSRDAAERMLQALEAAGVEFIDENGGGPGVRLRKPTKQKR
jgi:DNA-binding transcriptional regulator YiaG